MYPYSHKGIDLNEHILLYILSEYKCSILRDGQSIHNCLILWKYFHGAFFQLLLANEIGVSIDLTGTASFKLIDTNH
jgi:hypothetical protein